MRKTIGAVFVLTIVFSTTAFGSNLVLRCAGNVTLMPNFSGSTTVDEEFTVKIDTDQRKVLEYASTIETINYMSLHSNHETEHTRELELDDSEFSISETLKNFTEGSSMHSTLTINRYDGKARYQVTNMPPNKPMVLFSRFKGACKRYSERKF